MSLITRCPACGTMFKVVPDQLRISEGWVRCGHCAEVFDASVHMQDMSNPQPVPPPVQQAVPQADPDIALQVAAPSRVEGYPHMAPEEAVVSGMLEEVQEPEAPEVREEPEVPEAPEVMQAPMVIPPDVSDEVDLHNVPFVRDARRKAFWQGTSVRAALGLLLLVLLAALAFQVAVQERDRLAALQPELRPWLLALCEPLKCTLKAPRQIEAVVVEGSTFTRLRAESYRLAFTLKNQGAMTIAMPAVELTLTDSQDQTVVRRVLTPAELGSTTGVIAAGSDWAGSIALAVTPANGAGRVAGYRVLAFYP